MRITNKLNLPQPIVEAVRNDPYDAGDCDISVTRLINSPRYVELMRRHDDEIEEDAADNIYALLGKAVHDILERAEVSMITEKRLYTDCLGWRVSGAFDRMALVSGPGFKGRLEDYKVASVWEIIHGIKQEKVWQLNLLAELARRNGYTIDSLANVFILRDWQKSKAKRDKDYPQHQVAVVEQELWPKERASLFLHDRVRTHQTARESLPLCTDEERWKDPGQWAVMKAGRKSALRVLDSSHDAEAWIAANGHGDGLAYKPGISIEHRPSTPRRCEDYCSAAPFCEQWTAEREAQ